MVSFSRTSNGCGWGVKALENIRKGSFVVEYVGEVITSEEAEERGKKYGKYFDKGDYCSKIYEKYNE